jgi:hypothetical protein
MIAAWAIALGAIAPMLDSTMINIAIKQLNNAFNTTIEITQWGITIKLSTFQLIPANTDVIPNRIEAPINTYFPLN